MAARPRQAARWHRRLLAAGLLAASVAFAIQTLAPAPPPGASVVVAAHDLAAGAELGADDVRPSASRAPSVPAGALSAERAAAGRSLVSAVRRGEPLTDLRLVGSLVPRPARRGARRGTGAHRRRRVGAAAATRRRRRRARGRAADEPRGARHGWSPPPCGSSPCPALPATRSTRTSGGGLVLLVTTPSTAARLAAAAVTDRLSVVLRRGVTPPPGSARCGEPLPIGGCRDQGLQGLPAARKRRRPRRRRRHRHRVRRRHQRLRHRLHRRHHRRDRRHAGLRLAPASRPTTARSSSARPSTR